MTSYSPLCLRGNNSQEYEKSSRGRDIPGALWVGSERLGGSPDPRQNILQGFGFRILGRRPAYCGKAERALPG